MESLKNMQNPICEAFKDNRRRSKLFFIRSLSNAPDELQVLNCGSNNKNVKGESSGQFWLERLNSPQMGLYYNKREGKNVKLINKILIDDYQQKHADSVKPLENWKELVKLAKWHTPQDIRNAIRSADFLSGNRVIFNIGGNRHRLVVVVVYTAGQVYVQWIGTHAEYSKRKF